MSFELSIALCFIVFLLGCFGLVAGELRKEIKKHRKFVYTVAQREDEVFREIKKIIEEIQEKAEHLERVAKKERAARAFKASEK